MKKLNTHVKLNECKQTFFLVFKGEPSKLRNVKHRLDILDMKPTPLKSKMKNVRSLERLGSKFLTTAYAMAAYYKRQSKQSEALVS